MPHFYNEEECIGKANPCGYFSIDSYDLRATERKKKT